MKEFVIFDEDTAQPYEKKYSKEFTRAYNDSIGIMRKFLDDHEKELSLVEAGLVGEYISSFPLEVVSWFRMHRNRGVK